MKRVLNAMIGVLLIALNWAALHDILQGEPYVLHESGVVIASGLALVLFGVRALVQARRDDSASRSHSRHA